MVKKKGRSGAVGVSGRRGGEAARSSARDPPLGVAAVVGVGFACAYAWTAFPSIGGGDSGELLAEACVGGVAHPPGYGLYLALTSWSVEVGRGFGVVPGRAGALGSAVCGGVAAFAVAASAAAVSPPGGRGVAAVVGGVSFGGSALVWEYAAHAEVFSLNNALCGLGILAACRVMSCAPATDGAAPVGLWSRQGGGRQVAWVVVGAFLGGLCAAHQHAAALTAVPIASGAAFVAVPWRRLVVAAVPGTIAAVGAWAVPTWGVLVARSRAATAGSWGDLTTGRGLWAHVTRAEYGTFRLGARQPDAEPDAARRVAAYVHWTVAQATWALPALAALAVAAACLHVGSRRVLFLPEEERRAIRVLFWSWVFYVGAWHGIWSNLAIFQSAMAYEVHARFWMQPHLLLCVLGGAGAGLVASSFLSVFFSGGGRPAARRRGTHGSGGGGVCGGDDEEEPTRPVKTALFVAVAACATAFVARGRWVDYSDAWSVATHGAAILEGLPRHALLVSHTDLHWNPSRYARLCEERRQDVDHISAQLLPYAWFERQHSLHAAVAFPRVDPSRASTDVRSEAYRDMVVALVGANARRLGGVSDDDDDGDDFASEEGGIFIDMHGVYEPQIGAVGEWVGTPYSLVPWGLSYRILPREAVLGSAPAWVQRSLDQVAGLEALYRARGGASALAAAHRAGTWERAALCAYHDAHYQVGLFTLTFAQQLRPHLTKPEAFALYLRALGNATSLTALAADAAEAGALTSNARDAEKNALLAAMTLHGALAIAEKIAQQGGGDPGAIASRLRAVTDDAAKRGRRFLRDHPDDKDAPAFAKFLAWLLPQQPP